MRPAILHVGGTLYWTIQTYDPDKPGVLKDADSTPSVAVRKNGASSADSVTITKRSATTGLYDCSYNPAAEVEGDTFQLEETATVTGTTTSSATYTSQFSVRAVHAGAVELDSASVNAVADQVWDEATSGHTTAGTYGGRIVRATNTNVEVQITGSNHIAADVHELQAGVITAGDFAANSITASALATDAVTEIQSGLASQSSVDTLTSYVDTEIAAIKAKTDNLPSDPADQSLVEAAITAATSPLATPAQVNAQVLDVLTTDTFAELSAPPAATSSLKDKITWLFMYARNKVTQTALARTLYRDDTTTVAGTSATSDNGTTFTKGEDA